MKGRRRKNRTAETALQLWQALILSLIMILLLAGCAGSTKDGPGTVKEMTYTQITQDEAVKMMGSEGGHVIVDVRRPDEFAEGHIPGAVNIPNENIGSVPPEELPDLSQTILVYCRTGRRSKEASQKLADMGYSNVYEFGGIVDWTGEVVKEASAETAESLSGETTDGQAGETPGEQTGDDTVPAQDHPMLYIGGKEIPAEWEDNASVESLLGLIAERGGSLTIDMRMYGGFEQVGPLGQEIDSSDVQTATRAGDIVLYSGDQIVIFYGQNSWAYTRLGRISLSDGEIVSLLGSGPVTIVLALPVASVAP